MNTRLLAVILAVFPFVAGAAPRVDSARVGARRAGASAESRMPTMVTKISGNKSVDVKVEEPLVDEPVVDDEVLTMILLKKKM